VALLTYLQHSVVQS